MAGVGALPGGLLIAGGHVRVTLGLTSVLVSAVLVPGAGGRARGLGAREAARLRRPRGRVLLEAAEGQLPPLGLRSAARARAGAETSAP